MQNLNWPLLIVNISEALVLTQRELGTEIGTTQQSISNWLNGRRVPSEAKAKEFFRMAKKANISLESYQLPSKELQVIQKRREIKELPIKIRRLSFKITNLHPRRRKKILSYLEDMLDTLEKKHCS
jgi:transcriptional regulator with XRE-family HTH domain